ncbi:hypothetical protein [Maritimibacter dapengensis]|uniref:Uncharacterized protein n=1 Tax=Maritimibacter dapengensis TaxID=2836868 RepID=A0ABS6SZC2_9RHOB|nr:hypothetical protein [Maritimibacter dapengensis]MBV7378297.1 hypothetical protein [Maritimibacter dapengensis]
MDYNFESVPVQYLHADRNLFVSPEYLLQLDEVDNPDVTPGRHWYVDCLVIRPRDNWVFLAEFTFSQSVQGLRKRLSSWAEHWKYIPPAVARDSSLPSVPVVRPWAFVPEANVEKMVQVAGSVGFDGRGTLPALKITPLEMTLPWRYRYWRRDGEGEKPKSIPENMR